MKVKVACALLWIGSMSNHITSWQLASMMVISYVLSLGLFVHLERIGKCKYLGILKYFTFVMFHFTFSFPGLVALWDLASKSTLLKVRSPDGVVSLYPYHCFHAHDENIRTLSWCKASRWDITLHCITYRPQTCEL